MELLTPRELSQITQMQVSPGSRRLTISDSNKTLRDPLVKSTVRQLVDAGGHIVATRKTPGSRLIETLEIIEYTGKKELSASVTKALESRTAETAGSGQGSRRHTRKTTPVRKISRVLEVSRQN